MSKALKTIYIFMIYFFLYLPIVILIIYSFNNSLFSASWHGVTWKWYKALLVDKPLLIIAGHSLLLATLSATLATVMGALGSVALFRYRFYGKNVWHGLIFVLIVVPDLVLGISLLSLYSFTKISLGFSSLFLAHTTFCLPFVMVIVLGRLKEIDKNIFEVARDLGASDCLIFMRIILPLIVPSLVAGWLLSFTLSMDDVIISFFVNGPGFQILPLYIYSQIHVGITPKINALCSLVFVGTLILVVISHMLIRKKV